MKKLNLILYQIIRNNAGKTISTVALSLIVFISISVFHSGCNTSSDIQPRVLVIVGGHSYDTTEFFEMFRSMEEIRFDSVSHPRAMDLLASEQVNAYDVLLFYDFIKDMPESDSSIFLSLADYGMPMIFMHHALGTFQKWDGYHDLVGGRYVDEKFTDDTSLVSGYKHDINLNVNVIHKDHPVTSGIDHFEIHDEGYSNIMVSDGIKPILSVDHPDCYQYIAWENSYLNSATVYFMMGHDKLAYQNPNFQQLILNSINWLNSKD